MQRFTLLHDGSVQGWQATYLAFHVAARLGAPLQVLHIDPNNDDKALGQRAAHVETGSYAAGVTIETHLLADYSKGTLKEHITTINGLFLPLGLIPDEEAVSLFLDAFSCPLWVASKEPQINEMAVLVDDVVGNDPLINYTKTLSQRLGQTLTGLIRKDALATALSEGDASVLPWVPLASLSLDHIVTALTQLNASLLFIAVPDAFLAGSLPCNCVIYPNMQDA